MEFPEFVMLKNNAWRCPVCNRLLGHISKEGFLELETKNRQLIVTKQVYREGKCKCGVKTTISGSSMALVFHRLVIRDT